MNRENTSIRFHKVLISSLLVGSMLTTGTVAAKGSRVAVASASQYQTANVSIDGKLQTFEQSALIINGNTMVPMRAIFEKLGATIKWDQATQTVTGTKGGTVIKLTIGKSVAYINNKGVTLSAEPQVINGSTLVPLRFVSEALGAKVAWDADTYTAIIASTGSATQPSQPPVQNGGFQIVNSIKVKYGKHTYGSENQAEYDKVMEIVNKGLEGYENVRFDNGGEFEQYYKDFLDGQRWSGSRADSSTRNKGLKFAEDRLGALVKAGISKDTIEKVYKVSMVAYSLKEGAKDPQNGTPKSAYDALVRGITDCDADSQVFSAVFDVMGFNTAIIANPGDAKMVVELDGQWFIPISGGFEKVGDLPTTTNSSAPLFLHTAPTY